MPGGVFARVDLGAQWQKPALSCTGQGFMLRCEGANRRGGEGRGPEARILNLVRADLDIEPLYLSLSHLYPRESLQVRGDQRKVGCGGA